MRKKISTGTRGARGLEKTMKLYRIPLAFTADGGGFFFMRFLPPRTPRPRGDSLSFLGSSEMREEISTGTRGAGGLEMLKSRNYEMPVCPSAMEVCRSEIRSSCCFRFLPRDPLAPVANPFLV